MAGCCECGNEPLGYVKFGEFLDQVRNCKLVRKDSSSWSQSVSYLVSGICHTHQRNLVTLFMSVSLLCPSWAACSCDPSFALPAFCGAGVRRMLIKVKTGGALHSCLRCDRTFHCMSAIPFPFTVLERDLLLSAPLLLLCRTSALI